MPRGQAHEGPVIDGYGPTGALPQYGRAGDDALLERMQATVQTLPALSGARRAAPLSEHTSERYGCAGDATLMKDMPASPRGLSSRWRLEINPTTCLQAGDQILARV
jgi:hypothetical protein